MLFDCFKPLELLVLLDRLLREKNVRGLLGLGLELRTGIPERR
jgi:hypothetical protein